ncbi:protein exod [Haematobacter massiliensis]|uniref:Protein exod n=1 Tax=Haematobacter massiliensis TaxID=195105 RepID=A0A086Y8N7_9RHOB|nr:exopolysaccharide biosynthesis protein [Haematobacter massiliensis]KFI30637.1 protein exod [Haematobacter massiliensis]OWJ71526.1 protein exod [Haematobacter massiliensis]OWJ83456.1 protein exod [Haematobacter massiliensis]QBJ25103.1 exopolysaccharide biosynthesis protein [Haematobacter massiliensis]
MQFSDTNQDLGTTLRGTIGRIQGKTITLRALMEDMGEQGLLLICAIAALPFLIPVSIPGVSTVFGAAIILIAIAVTLNRMPWLPRKVLDREIATEKLKPALERGVNIVERINRFIKPRLYAMTEGGLVTRINALAIAVSGLLLMAPFGFVPFSNTLPGVAVLLLALGMIQRDGLVVIGGYVMMFGTMVYFTVLFWLAFRAGQLALGG